MKILLFGKNGQVGWELNRSLQPFGEVVALAREGADFSQPESLREIVRDVRPDVIVNAVAYTAVDKAESEESLAKKINGIAPGILAEEALKLGSLLVHYSTDYVFSGDHKTPYLETDEPAPVNAYGRTKLAGEVVIKSSGCEYLIFRTSWVYASRGQNFLLTISKLMKEREELSIVADQIGSPTSARLIADTTSLGLKNVMEQKRAGSFSSKIYHLTTSGFTSWCGFAEEIMRIESERLGQQLNVKSIKSIPTTDYPTPARRPINSRLSQANLERDFNIKMPDWRKTLILCLEEIYEK